jgi:hypothetical protein
MVFIPSLNTKLVGYVLQTSASGGRPCVVLDFVPDTVPTVVGKWRNSYPEALDHNEDLRLRIMALEDGIYFVRPWNTRTKDIGYVDKNSVIEMKGCSENPEKSAPV